MSGSRRKRARENLISSVPWSLVLLMVGVAIFVEAGNDVVTAFDTEQASG